MQPSQQSDTSEVQNSRHKIFVALAGNPNSGKTSLFNALTGSHYKVANYPGITVERKEGEVQLGDDCEICLVDLPGLYSLSQSALDESLATKTLLGELIDQPAPDLIVSVVDSCSLERNLFLTTQIIDLGIPTILALNMCDLAEREGIQIKNAVLSRFLDIPVVSLSAKTKSGVEELRTSIKHALKSKTTSSAQFRWLPRESTYRNLAGELGLKARERSKTHSAPILFGSLLLSQSLTIADHELISQLKQARNDLQIEGIDASSYETTQRYRWINTLVQKCLVRSKTNTGSIAQAIDQLTTHRIWGLVLFVAMMALVFQSIFAWASAPMELIEKFVNALGVGAASILPNNTLRSLLVDGIIAGVGSVLVFIPQIALLFFFIGLLEDSGYLARAAFIMDKVMRKFGLQGRSFVPLLSSFACAIPGIMSTRTIPSVGDRMTTILIAPLMSCSARLPVYALMIAAFIPAGTWFGFSIQGLTLFSMYALGVVFAAIVARILRFSLFRGEPAIFVMEIPPLRLPSIKIVLREVIDRIIIFIKGAGTIILACSILLWFLASYPKGDLKDSYAGRIGHFIEPAIKPLGFNWEIGVGILASFAAREVFVSTLATVYNIEDKDSSSLTLTQALKNKNTSGEYSLAAALALMVFYVFACQCMSTLAVCKRETGSWKWPVFMFVYMTSLAYVMGFIVYRLALLLES